MLRLWKLCQKKGTALLKYWYINYLEIFALFSVYTSLVVEVVKYFQLFCSNHNYLSGSFFASANKSKFTDHFNRLTHLTKLQYRDIIDYRWFVSCSCFQLIRRISWLDGDLDTATSNYMPYWNRLLIWSSAP